MVVHHSPPTAQHHLKHILFVYVLIKHPLYSSTYIAAMTQYHIVKEGNNEYSVSIY